MCADDTTCTDLDASSMRLNAHILQLVLAGKHFWQDIDKSIQYCLADCVGLSSIMHHISVRLQGYVDACGRPMPLPPSQSHLYT